MRQKRPKRRILWIETAGFSTILGLTWLTELVGIPHLLYGEPFTPNWHRAILRTIVIVGVWVWVHHETKRVLRRLHHLEEFLLICPWCRRIGDQGEWVSMERYFGTRFATRTNHGMCPDCARRLAAKGVEDSV